MKKYLVIWSPFYIENVGIIIAKNEKEARETFMRMTKIMPPCCDIYVKEINEIDTNWLFVV